MNVVVILLFTYFIASLLTRYMLLYTQRNGLLDIPNDRSSHSRPTPLGGGVGIVLAFLLMVAVLLALGKIVRGLGIALLVGGCVLAIIGWLDDRKGISALLRLMVHIASALWAVYWIGGLPYLRLGPYTLELGHWGSALSVIGIVWMINLYNFMDGIDGLAGAEAATVGAFAGLFSAAIGKWDLAILCWVLSVASLGFLRWNWPPARIFMGDVGSGFLGFTFATLAIASENSGGLPLILWMSLLGVFIVDATITLVSRMVRGERLAAAHREHVYQLAVQAGYSHKSVTTAVLFLNCVIAVITWVCLHSQGQWAIMLILLGWLALLLTHHVLRQRFRTNQTTLKKPSFKS